MRGGKTDLHRFNGPSLQHLCDSNHKLAIMPTLSTENMQKTFGNLQLGNNDLGNNYV